MADHEASKINVDNHFLLDQPLLRLPLQLLHKNFRSSRYHIEKDARFVKGLLKETATASLNGRAERQDVVKNLDQMLAKMRGLKRKMAAYAEEEAQIHRQIDARVAHLCELQGVHTVDDVKYETWSRQRLDRLLVDYMLRHGYNESATALAKERGICDLVDIDTFVAMSKIRKSLEEGSVKEALAWCEDNKKQLRSNQSNLEFMLRCQQYIEMMRTGSETKMVEAIAHAKKYITPFNDTYQKEVSNMAGLLAYRPDTPLEPYATLYSSDRWQILADLFVDEHLKLLGLPKFPLLHTALSSGLSALKTPACHSSNQTPQSPEVNGHATPPSAADPTQQQNSAPASGEITATTTTPPVKNMSSLATSVCPICSTELNELARVVPYAHHSKSHLLDNDLVALPNSRVYGRAKLREYAIKSGLPKNLVKDLHTGDVFEWSSLKRVYIT